MCISEKLLETIFNMQKSKQYEWTGMCSTRSFNNQLIHCLLLKILKMYKSPHQKRKGLAFRKQGEFNMQEKEFQVDDVAAGGESNPHRSEKDRRH